MQTLEEAKKRMCTNMQKDTKTQLIANENEVSEKKYQNEVQVNALYNCDSNQIS